MYRLVALVVAVCLLAFARPASASPIVQVRVSTDGGATFAAPIADNGPGDTNPGANSVLAKLESLNLVLHAFGFFSPEMSLFDLSIQGILPPGNHNIVIQATVTDLVTNSASATLTNSVSGSILPSQADALAQTWIDGANAPFGTTGGSIVVNTGPTPLLTLQEQTFSVNGPFSVTTQMTFSVSSPLPQSVSLDTNHVIISAPEPASLVVFGVVTLVGGALAYRRRAGNAGQETRHSLPNGRNEINPPVPSST